MGRRWTPKELSLWSSLSSKEYKLLRNRAGVLRPGFASFLKLFRPKTRFP